MKRILLSIAVIALVSTVSVGATRAFFVDTETVEGNTFSTGNIDLTVDGDNGVIGVQFSSNELIPGETINVGTVELKNEGSIAGKITLQVKNPVSNENGLVEPETSDGDIDGEEIDPTGYDANEGDGELWDMSTLNLFVDVNNDGEFQWNEPVIWRGDHLDMTSYYSIPLDTNLFPADHGFDETLEPGESVHVGLLVTFKTDAQLASQPQYIGLTNNMAMTDDMTFDLEFGLEQIQNN